MNNRTRSTKRSAKVLLTVLFVLGFLLLLPAMWLMLVRETSSHQIVHARRPQQPVREAILMDVDQGIEPIRSDPAHTSGRATVLRATTVPDPAADIQYVPQQRQVYEPFHNAETGQVEYQPRVETFHGAGVIRQGDRQTIDPRVQSLAAEIRGLSEGDEQRVAKLEELTELLNAEFATRHKQQAERIAQAAKQLESLQQTHDERNQRKHDIVERRIETLIGQPDVLKWLPSESVPPPPLALPKRSGLPVPAYANNVPPPSVKRSNSDWAPAGPEPDVHVTPKPGVPPRTDPGFDNVLPIQRPSPHAKSPQRESQLADPRQSPRRIEISTSTSGDLFAVARQLSAAILAEVAAKSDYEQLVLLQDDNLVSRTEVQRALLKFEQAKRELLFARAEMEATSRGLESDLRFAESRLEKAIQVRDLVKTRVENGTVSTQDLLEHETLVATAEKHLSDIRAKLEQLAKVQQVVQGEQAAGGGSEDFEAEKPIRNEPTSREDVRSAPTAPPIDDEPASLVPLL